MTRKDEIKEMVERAIAASQSVARVNESRAPIFPIEWARAGFSLHTYPDPNEGGHHYECAHHGGTFLDGWTSGDEVDAAQLGHAALKAEYERTRCEHTFEECHRCLVVGCSLCTSCLCTAGQ